MKGLRTWSRRHRALAALALALMLSVKLLMPSGFMFATDAKVLTVVICSGVSSEHQTTQLIIPQSGEKSGHEQGKADPCPYSALSMAAASVADAPLLTAALAFILVLGFAPVVAPPRQYASRLRPPLRGPPVVA